MVIILLMMLIPYYGGGGGAGAQGGRWRNLVQHNGGPGGIAGEQASSN